MAVRTSSRSRFSEKQKAFSCNKQPTKQWIRKPLNEFQIKLVTNEVQFKRKFF